MKKLLTCLSAAVALTASAAWQKVVTVQVADTESLVQGVTKFGEMTGNMMLGTMAAGALAEMPGTEMFGPGREKTPMTFCLFVDEDEVKKVLESEDKKPSDPDKLWSYAILYPVAQSKAAFVKEHEGCKEKDGVLRVVEDEELDEEEDASYVVFSQDGKWASMSDKPAQAKAALEDVRLAARPMKGDLAKVVVTPKGLSVFRQILEQVQKSAKDEQDKDGQKTLDCVSSMLQGMSAVAAGVSVDDAGISARMSVGTVKGSEIAKCGLKSLGADPLAFAPKSSVMACAFAADCGQRSVDIAELLKVLAKHGIKTESFLKVEERAANTSVLTLDLTATVAYAKTLTNKLDKASVAPLMKDLEALVGFDAFRATSPAMSTAFALKGYEASVTPAARFAAILPEAAQKKPYSVQILSLYSVFKAVLPIALAEQSEEDRADLAPFLSMLPADGKGGIAVAGWREKNNLKAIFRVSADEVKNLSGIFAAASAYSMQQAMKKAQQEGAQNAAKKKAAKKQTAKKQTAKKQTAKKQAAKKQVRKAE